MVWTRWFYTMTLALFPVWLLTPTWMEGCTGQRWEGTSLNRSTTLEETAGQSCLKVRSENNVWKCLCWILLGCVQLCQHVSDCVSMCQNMLGLRHSYRECIDFLWECFKWCQSVSCCIRICQCVLKDIRLNKCISKWCWNDMSIYVWLLNFLKKISQNVSSAWTRKICQSVSEFFQKCQTKCHTAWLPLHHHCLHVWFFFQIIVSIIISSMSALWNIFRIKHFLSFFLLFQIIVSLLHSRSAQASFSGRD